MPQSAPSLVRRNTRIRPLRRRWHRRGQAAVLLAAALALCPHIVGGSEISTRQSDPFAVIAASGTNLAPFHKWQSVVQRYAQERQQARIDSCQATAPTSVACLYAAWARMLEGLRGLNRQEQLRAVNRDVNGRAYVTDLSNWGVEDYWETPAEFLAKGGDCEDFAILKFLSLRQLGWTGETLRIAAVFDTRLNIGHAIVIAEDAGHTWILDNQIPDVVEAASVPHYQPIYSLTETSWRLHHSIEQATGSAGRDGEAATDTPGAGRQ